MKFHIIDNNAQLITGAASLRTGAVNQQNGEKITFGCLIKIEHTGPNTILVTTRTVSPASTAAILQTVRVFLC